MLLLFLHTLIYFYFWCILWSIFELHLKNWISFFLEFFLLSWLLISCIRCLRFFCFSDSSPINESIWGFPFVYIQTEYVAASSMDSTMVFQPDCALVGFSTSLMFLNTFSLYSFLSISFLRLLSRYFCIQQFEETIHDHCFNVARCLHATIWFLIRGANTSVIPSENIVNLISVFVLVVVIVIWWWWWLPGCLVWRFLLKNMLVHIKLLISANRYRTVFLWTYIRVN